jgi:hypothetical protein
VTQRSIPKTSAKTDWTAKHTCRPIKMRSSRMLGIPHPSPGIHFLFSSWSKQHLSRPSDKSWTGFGDGVMLLLRGSSEFYQLAVTYSYRYCHLVSF